MSSTALCSSISSRTLLLVQQGLLQAQAMKQTATKPRPAGKREANFRPGPAYLALIELFPLRPLRSERDYDAAVTVLDTLAVRPEGSLDSGEQDYLDTLTMLVEAYDRAQHEIHTEQRDPLSMLVYLMQESGMTQADLGRLLGNRALASLILHGRRQLSKSHIR
jgi:HTH-type transcriptional regulator/antitoxin HigA